MEIKGVPLLQTHAQRLVCSGAMAAAATSSSPHSLATASGLLLGTTGACMAVGALIGWALGGWALGILAGMFAGIPLAIFFVYRTYSRQG
jgi:hypothetical protein